MQNLRKIKTSPVNVRVPEEWREKARELARSQSSNDVRFNESDVYRNAIGRFLFGDDFTESKVRTD